MRLNYYLVILKFLFISCIRISSNDFFTSAVPTADYTKREILNLQDSIFETIQKNFIISTETNEFDLYLSKVNSDGFERKVWGVGGSYPGPAARYSRGDRVLIQPYQNDAYCYHSHQISQYADGSVADCLHENNLTLLKCYSQGNEPASNNCNWATVGSNKFEPGHEMEVVEIYELAQEYKISCLFTHANKISVLVTTNASNCWMRDSPQ